MIITLGFLADRVYHHLRDLSPPLDAHDQCDRTLLPAPVEVAVDIPDDELSHIVASSSAESMVIHLSKALAELQYTILSLVLHLCRTNMVNLKQVLLNLGQVSRRFLTLLLLHPIEVCPQLFSCASNTISP